MTLARTLVPFNPRRVPTVWMDPAGLKLADVLRRARAAGAERVMLTGKPLPAGFLLQNAPGWTHDAHHLDHATPVGRYVNDAPMPPRGMEVRRAAEWFGEGDYTVNQAETAWSILADALRQAVPGAGLLGSPGATGREAWLRSLPRKEGRTVVPPQVDDETAELLRATSGQHRIELRPAPAPGAQLDGLWVLDGRLMYAACVRELGEGPVTRQTAAAVRETWESPRGLYARARYRVRATVPSRPAWDRVGILPYAEPGGDTWTYPSEPGRTFETWADAAEVHLALDWGWEIEPLEGIAFRPGRPLDTWATRLLRGYDRLDPRLIGETQTKMVRAGFRWMLLHSVGAWHSTGRTETTVTEGPMHRPAGDGWGAPERTKAGAIWRRRVPLDGRAALMAHPEYSAQIWGRARARVLSAPTAERGAMAGALYVEPTQLVSIYGDAVMTTGAPPYWAAPEYDDGKPGRLRVKGHLPGAHPWPTTGSARDRLMHQAETTTKGGTQK